MEELFVKIKEYIDTRFQLIKLDSIEKGSSVIGSVITSLIVIILMIMFFLFLSFATGFYLSEVLGDSYSGFVIVTLFYFLTAFILFLLRKPIKRAIVNNIIKNIFKEDEK